MGVAAVRDFLSLCFADPDVSGHRSDEGVVLVMVTKADINKLMVMDSMMTETLDALDAHWVLPGVYSFNSIEKFMEAATACEASIRPLNVDPTVCGFRFVFQGCEFNHYTRLFDEVFE